MPTLPKNERLRGAEAIGRLFDHGARGASATVAALALPAEQTGGGAPGPARVAFIAGKKLGNSVLRNRLRRRLRAAYRLQKDGLALPPGQELALMAKRNLAEARWADVMRDVKLAAERALGGGSCGPRPHRQSR